MKSSSNTREKLLQQAEKLFSKKGFYGTSINDIAATLNISKQALLHHFASKEKLYAAVLQKVNCYLLGYIDKAVAANDLPSEQLKQIFLFDCVDNARLLQIHKLLMRELLDNCERVDSARHWYLRPTLEALVLIVQEGQKQGQFQSLHAQAFVYHLLGSMKYYLISSPTLRQLYPEQEFLSHQHYYRDFILRMLES